MDPRVSAVIGPRAAAAATQGYLARLLAEGPRGVRATRGGNRTGGAGRGGDHRSRRGAGGGGRGRGGGRGARRAEAPGTNARMEAKLDTKSHRRQSRRSKKMETEAIERRDLSEWDDDEE